LPLASKVAVWPSRGLDKDPVSVNESVLGSYSSADAFRPELSAPPAIRTLPLCSKVAVCEDRWVDIGPVVAENPTGWAAPGAEVRVVAGVGLGAAFCIAVGVRRWPCASAGHESHGQKDYPDPETGDH